MISTPPTRPGRRGRVAVGRSRRSAAETVDRPAGSHRCTRTPPRSTVSICLRGVGLRVETITDSEVQLCRERLSDRDLVDTAWIDRTTRDDPSAIHDGAEASYRGLRRLPTPAARRGASTRSRRSGATAATPLTRPNACSCDGVASPTVNSSCAARLDALNRASADSERRAPATVDSTTAPTTPTNNVRTTTRRHRRRISNPASIRTAPTATIGRLMEPRHKVARLPTPGGAGPLRMIARLEPVSSRRPEAPRATRGVR